jgi:predicted transcriptional regulator
MTNDLPELGQLEREVMLLVWTDNPITAESVRERLDRPLKDSTVRTVLRRLEEKGFVTHDVEGRTFLFRPVEDRRKVAAKAVRRIADWLCNGSIEDVLVGIVDAKMLSKSQLDQLLKKIGQAKNERK